MKTVKLLGVVSALLAWAGGARGACPHTQADLEPWSSGSTWGGQVPVGGDDVVIPEGKKVLLDVSPPPLGSLTVPAGTTLVWGDVDGLQLSADFIHVLGRFDIGSEDCRFTRKANIRLTGLVNSSRSVAHFGKKFLGVGPGGTLEVHGAEKKAWTKLSQTVPAALDTCGVVYDHRSSAFGQERMRGVQVIVWNNDGSVFDFLTLPLGENNWRANDSILEFRDFVSDLPDGKVVGVAVKRDLGVERFPARPWEDLYAAVETLGGLAQGASQLRLVGDKEAYALIARKGDPASTVEERGVAALGSEVAQTAPLSLVDASQKLKFSARSTVRVDSTMSHSDDVEFTVLHTDVAFPIIQVADDVSSWNVGDEIVITSTDYDWRQAETFTIRPCDTCANNEIRLDREFQYSHFGEVTYGVDERAEVALLTRNIQIEGVMADRCYNSTDSETEACEIFNEDTHGGHVKFLKGFSAIHVEGVELFHVGQAAHVGTYPLHFHMCDDVDGAWLRNNSIHHSFTRCITVHGTDGLEVSDNVCYLTRGHGYFLEDSAEQRNILDGNIGIGTQHGLHLLTDRKREWCNQTISMFCNALSTFWLTHPNNYIRNNVAAGSDKHGFMYIFAKWPLGPSRARQLERGLVGENTARRTPVAEFFNNVAHSNRDRGLFFDRGITPGSWIDGVWVPENGHDLINRHDPLVDPTNRRSAKATSYIVRLTAYKNIFQNVWCSGGNIVIANSSLADSPRAFGSSHSSSNTAQEVKDSLIIGETENKGKPATFSTNGLVKKFDHSLPFNNPNEPVTGISFFQGPIYVTNTYFDRFRHNYWSDRFDALSNFQAWRPGGAISWKHPGNPYPATAHSSVRDIKFGFCDSTQGNWVFWGNNSVPRYSFLDGVRQATFHDIDGSVTGLPGSQVVRDIPFFTTPKCHFRDNWVMAVCPHSYSKVFFSGDDGVLEMKNSKSYPISVHRDDAHLAPFALRGDKALSFLMMKDKSYIVNFNGTNPTNVKITGHNIEQGQSVRLGLCFPKSTTTFTFSKGVFTRQSPVYVDSVAAVDSDLSGRSVFWDKDKGLLFVKLLSNATRVGVEKCPGFKCPMLQVQRGDGGSASINCTADAYGPYIVTPETATTETPRSCNKGSPTGLGVPVADTASATTFQVTCPATPSPPAALDARGCFKDNSMFRDLPYKFQELIFSQTRQHCIDRCRNYGYAFAGLQNGRQCRCGNFYGAYGESATGCTKKCMGKRDETCGGAFLNEIFATGNPEPAALPPCGPSGEGVEVAGRCLYLGEDKRDVFEARRACRQLGGDLATLNSADVMSKVEQYLRPHRVNAWFGLHDTAVEGQFEFFDGTPLGDYSNWRPGQGSSDRRDFTQLEASSLYRWRDVTAWTKAAYLCQVPSDSSSLPAAAPCGLGGLGKRIGANGKCYAVINEAKNLKGAMYKCLTNNGVLASVATEAEKAEVQEHLYRFGEAKDYWTIDMADVTSSRKFIEMKYTQFYETANEKSGARNYVVCHLEELSAEKRCSTGWELHGDNCYLYLGSTEKSYDTAAELCDGPNSGLVTIHSAEENDFVASLAEAFDPTKKPTIGLGYRYNAASGQFEWRDGVNSGYSNWRSGYGVSKIASGECARMRTNISGDQWDNLKCSKGIFVMCKSSAFAIP